MRQRRDRPASNCELVFQQSIQVDDLYKYRCNSNDYLEVTQDCLTDLRVGALDVNGLEINVEADHK